MDQTFPGINTLFSGIPRQADGHEKWIDFVSKFWHCDCIAKLSETVFAERYRRWCQKTGYRATASKVKEIYELAHSHTAILPKNEFVQQLISQAVNQLNTIMEALAFIIGKMNELASCLPEYPIVMSMHGVGKTLGPQLIAEIGDIRRFRSKQSLVAFAGIDAPPFQSGAFEAQHRHISKRGSPVLRKTLFLLMLCILQNRSSDDPIFQYLDKKRAEGKHYYIYMIAGANKFLRIYYARIKEYLLLQDAVPPRVAQ